MVDFEPGSWPVIYPAGQPDIFEESGVDQSIFEAVATENLWNWTGRIFGTRDVDVRPVRFPKPWAPSSFEGLGPWPVNPGYGSSHSTVGFNLGYWSPVLIGAAWASIFCGVCGKEECYCRGDQVKTIALPGPVVEVKQITVDGVVLDPTAYWLRQKRWLERIDGQPWPFWQDLNLSPSAPNTWEVTYTKGVVVPTGGQVAAGTLAEQLALAAVDSGDCKLPKRIQTITREGVTIGMLDPFAATKSNSRSTLEIPKVDTGIWEIDSWMSGVNMPRLYASVRSVDVPANAAPNFEPGSPRANYSGRW